MTRTTTTAAATHGANVRKLRPPRARIMRSSCGPYATEDNASLAKMGSARCLGSSWPSSCSDGNGSPISHRLGDRTSLVTRCDTLLLSGPRASRIRRGAAQFILKSPVRTSSSFTFRSSTTSLVSSFRAAMLRSSVATWWRKSLITISASRSHCSPRRGLPTVGCGPPVSPHSGLRARQKPGLRGGFSWPGPMLNRTSSASLRIESVRSVSMSSSSPSRAASSARPAAVMS